MALNESLNLSVTEAERKVVELGKRLDTALRDRALNLRVNTADTNVLNAITNQNLNIRGGGSSGAQAREGIGQIRALQQLNVEFEDTVRQGARARQSIADLTRAQETAERRSDLLNRSWGRLVITMASLAGAAKVAEFFRESAKAASDTVESVNAVEKVYDEAAGSIERFLLTADKIGISAVAGREIAAQFGALAQAFGFSNTQAAEFSNTLTQISADLGSIFNVDPEDATRRIFGLFRGEPEPARAIGLSVTANQIADEAIRAGLVKTRAELDETTRAQATYNLILQQSENTANDFANTLAVSLPNQLRVAQAELANAQARIGEGFQQPLLDGIKAIRQDAIPALEAAVTGIDISGLTERAIPPLVELIETLAVAIPALIEVAVGIGGVFTTIVGGAALLSNTIGTTGTELVAVTIAAQRASAAFDSSLAGSVIFAADSFQRLSAEGRTATDTVIGFGEAAAAGALAGGVPGVALGLAVGGLSVLWGEYKQNQAEATEALAAFDLAVEAALPDVRTLQEDLALLAEANAEIQESIRNNTDPDELIPNIDTSVLAVQERLKTMSEEARQVVVDFREAGFSIEDFGGALAAGTDIFEDFQDQVDHGVPIEAALNNLRGFAEASGDPRIVDAVDTFIAYGEAVEFDRDILFRLADVVDESADLIDDRRVSLEETAKQELMSKALTSDYYLALLNQAEALALNTDTLDPYTRTVREAAAQQARLNDLTAAYSDADAGSLIGDAFVTPPQIQQGFDEIVAGLDRADDKARALAEGLSGPLREAVDEIFADGVFGDDDARRLQFVIDQEGLEADLEEAELSIVEFVDLIKDTTNEKALLFAEGFAKDLADTLATIDAQLTVNVSGIEEDDGLDDVQQLLDAQQDTVNEFNRRRAAAANLDLLGFEETAKKVLAGEYDFLIDEANRISEGSTGQFQAVEDNILSIAAIRQAAGEEAAVVAQLNFFDAFLAGFEERDPVKEWLAGIELTADDFVGLLDQFVEFMAEDDAAYQNRILQGLALTTGLPGDPASPASPAGALGDSINTSLSGIFASDELIDNRKEDGKSVLRAFVDGITEAVDDGLVDVTEAATELAELIRTTAEEVLGISSPSKVAREIGGFFDQGLADGLLEGRTAEAAERITKQLAEIVERVNAEGFVAVDLSGVFTDTIDDPDTLEDETVDTWTNVFNNIRDRVNAAAEAAQQELFVIGQREDAIEILQRLGGFDQLEAAVASGAADELLNKIIRAPNAAQFGQIERELVRAGSPFDSLTEPAKAEGERVGTEFAFSVIEAQKRTFDGDTAGDRALLRWAERAQRDLEEKWETGSPSKYMQRLAGFLDQGFALGLDEASKSEDAFNRFLQFDESDLTDIDVERTATVVVEVDQTALEELANTVLELNANITVQSVQGQPVGNLLFFDKGGYVDRPTLGVFGEGRDEIIFGRGHDPNYAVDLIDRVGMLNQIAPVVLERAYGVPAGAINAAGGSQGVSEFAAMRSELAAMRAAAETSADRLGTLTDIYGTVDAGVKAIQRTSNTTVLRRGGAVL